MTAVPALRRRFGMAALAVLAAVAVACTGGDDAGPTTTVAQVTTTVAVTVAETVPPDLTDTFVQALVDPSVGASSIVVTGSDAARYLELRRTSAAILGEQLSVRFEAAGPRLCSADECATIGDLVLDGGLVASLSVDGAPVAGRISGIGTLADADGVVSRVRTAYVTNEGRLAVVLVTTNTTDVDVELFGFASVYQPTTGGSGVEAAGSWGEWQIVAGASGTSLLVFDTNELGGRLTTHGLRADGLDVTLDIPVPAP